MIEVLSNKDKARTRINVFHDSSSNWINLIKELIGNSLDIFNEDELHHITINLLSNTKVEYIDDGCGVPLEGVASNGMPNYQAIFEVDFAGSRYGNTGQTVGQNGVFFWTLAMTSKDFAIEVGRPDGNIYTISYHKGDRISDLQIIGKTDRTYTKVTFEPDDEVWTNPNYTFDELSIICDSQAAMGNIAIKLSDGTNGKIFRYESGIKDFFNTMTTNKAFISDNIYFTKQTHQLVEKKHEEFPIDIEMILAFSNDSNDDLKKDFLNTADLIKYGTINKGIVTGLKNHINRYLKSSSKYIKNEKQITDEDIELGLNYICNVKSNYIEYVSQSKQATDAPHYRLALQRVIEEFMEVYFVENPIEAEKICNQVLVNKRSREKANQTRLNIQKKLGSENKGGLSRKIEGLKDCDMRHSTLEERIFLVDEGLSANSTIIEAFDNRYMGCMGLRGRFINSLKASVEDVLNNEPAIGIIKSLGCGIEIPYEERKNFKDIKTFNIDDLRYGMVGILCDADSFGKGISLAIITFFKKFMPTLLKQGRIYLVISPRYEVRNKKKESFYAYNEKERDLIVEELGKDFLDISIRKGLGEFNKEEFWEFVLSPEARKSTFIKVLYEGDEKLINEKFEALMGDDIQGRKEFIRNNITNIKLDEID